MKIVAGYEVRVNEAGRITGIYNARGEFKSIYVGGKYGGWDIVYSCTPSFFRYHVKKDDVRFA